MFKIILLILAITSCSNNQSNIRKDQENRRQKEEEKLKKLEEDKKKLEILNSLKDLIIKNSENLENTLKTFEALLKEDYLNHIYTSEDEKINGKTLLMIAIEAEKIAFVKILLKQNALDANLKSKEGKRALEYAIRIKNLALIEELLKRKEIFIEYNYFSIYKSYSEKGLYKLLDKAYNEKKDLTEKLYKLFLNDDIDEEEIKNFVQNGANLNYSEYVGSNRPILINYEKILRDKTKIKLLLKYGLEKITLATSLVRIEYPQFDISLDYFKFLVEDVKIDLNFETEKSMIGSSNWRASEKKYSVNLIGEIYENISKKKEILEYILTSNYIDINKICIKRIYSFYTYYNNHIVIDALENYDYDLISLLLDNSKLDINYVFENYLPKSNDYKSFLYNKILYKNGLKEAQALNLLEKLFRKGLSEQIVKSQDKFLEEIKTGQNRLEKARNLVIKYYPNIKFKK